MAIKYLNELNCEDQVVLVRFDFNVPLDDQQNITDSTRIDLAIPTIQTILEKKPKKLILMSHLGRPKGQANPKFSLEPVANYLAEKIDQDIALSEKSIDTGIDHLIRYSKAKIILLENLRFHPEEESNDRDFAEQLSEYADYYVNDAFGAAHRKHASTYEINAFFKNKAYAGLLMEREVKALEKATAKPEKPFVAIIGGAKVSDKIKTIEKLLPIVDHLLIGGAMAYPFLKAKGKEVGKSLCSDEDVKLAKSILNSNSAIKIKLPSDHIVAADINGEAEICASENIPELLIGLDIGEKTCKRYSEVLRSAKTVLWNGPMGLFENPQFSKGTFKIAEILSGLDAFTVVGGGDSVSAVKKSGLPEKMSHVSTGGGASLEYIENGDLPGLKALRFGIE